MSFSDAEVEMMPSDVHRCRVDVSSRRAFDGRWLMALTMFQPRLEKEIRLDAVRPDAPLGRR